MLHSIGLADPTINYAPFAPYPNTSTLSANGISQPDTNPNPMLSALPRSAHGISSATTAAMAAAAAAASAGISPNIKDSRWLTLEVCRQYQRNQCSRDESECKFAHPPTHVDVQSGRVVCCYDSIKGKCQRRDPPCKYLHPPQHLKEQLIQNGRNNMIMRNMQFQLLTQQYLARGGLVPLTAAAAVAAANAGNPNGTNANPTGPTGTTSNSLLYGTPALTIGGPGAPNPYQVLTTNIPTNFTPTAIDTILNSPSNRLVPDLTAPAFSAQQLEEPPTKFKILIDRQPKSSNSLLMPVKGSELCNSLTRLTSPRKRPYSVLESDPVGSGSTSMAKFGAQLGIDTHPCQNPTMGFSPYLNGLSTSGLASFHGIAGPPALNDSNGHLSMRSTLADMKNGGINLYSPSTAAVAAAAALAHLNGIGVAKQENGGDSMNGCVMLMNGTSMDSMKPKDLNTSHTNGSSVPLNSIPNGHSGTNQTSQPNNGLHNGTSVITTNTNNINTSQNNNNLAVVASLISWQQNGTPMAIPHPTSLTPDSLSAAVAAVTGQAGPGPTGTGATNGGVGHTSDLASHYTALPDHPAYFQPAYHIEIPPFPFH